MGKVSESPDASFTHLYITSEVVYINDKNVSLFQKKLTIDDEIEFCDEDVLSAILKCKVG